MRWQPKEITWELNERGCHICTSHKPHKKLNGILWYPMIRRNGKYELIHRYIYEQNFGKIPKLMEVTHFCDNPLCINPKHLILGTHKENMRQMIERKRIAIGQNNGQSRLTEKQVLEIFNSNERYVKLARKYFVTPSTIRAIKIKSNWSWLTSKENKAVV